MSWIIAQRKCTPCVRELSVLEESLDIAHQRNEDTSHSQSFCMSIITRAVVFGSNELSCGHLYGEASMLDSILDIDKIEVFEVRRVLCSETMCSARSALVVPRDLDEENVKQLNRRRVKLRVDGAGFR